MHGHLGLLKDLHGRGAELDDVPGSYSLLHVAAGLGRHAVVAFLLDLGHDPDGAANEEADSWAKVWGEGGEYRDARPRLPKG